MSDDEEAASSSVAPAARHAHLALLGATLVLAVCGLVYELLAGTISSYLLGDSVYQFSIVIGVFMAAMGIGAFLSRHVRGDLASAFVVVQLTLGVAGGLSAPLLFLAFGSAASYDLVLLLVLLVTGALVGVEIPLIVRLLRAQRSLRVNLSNVLTLDYGGALLAALLFPMFLVPQLGLIRTGALFGALNVAVGALALYVLVPRSARRGRLCVLAGVCAALLGSALLGAAGLERFFETRLYTGTVIHARSSPYQRIVITEDAGVVNLYINGGLQFSSIDEYRYHEALVVPAMALAERHAQVLILGGGDGLALRQVLAHEGVEAVTVVDLDAAITELFSRNERLAALNGAAFADPRVTVLNEDAGKFLERVQSVFDVIIADLPDPHDVNLSRLYTRSFYVMASRRLAAGGVMVTQATSPFYAREAFWSIVATLRSVPSPYRRDQQPLDVIPYHAYVPTFGEWGFVMASPRRLDWQGLRLSTSTRFLSQDTLAAMPVFAPDMAALDVEPNTLHTHPLPRYYRQGWSRWYR